ncbi:MAG: MFS transporter [Anaerolineales bacterium]|nr:MFS transporter [Anaerolineales bacterium]
MRKLDAYPVYLILEGATSLIFAVVFTVNMVYQVTVAELNPLQLVLVGTTLELSVFIFEVPTGVVADVYSRRLSVIIGYFLIGAGYLLEGSLPIFWTIVLAQVVWGLGYTFTSGATEAWISDEIGEAAAGKAFLRGSQVGMLGGLIGIGISVILGSIRVNVPILTGGGLFILLALLLILVMPEKGFKPIPKSNRDSWQNMADTFKGGLRMVKESPALLTILGIGLFYGLYSEGFDRLWTKHILDDFTFPGRGFLQPVAWFGIIRAVGMLLSIGATEIARRKVNTNSYRNVAWVLSTVTAVLVGSLIVLSKANTFVLAISVIWVIGVSRNVIGPLYTNWVNQRLESGVRATVLSMSSQVDAIGQILGGPVLGAIGLRFSVQAAIMASGLVLSPVLALYARAIRREERQFTKAATLD